MGQKAIPATVSSMTMYEVKGDTEMNEGRGPLRLIGYFINEDLAKAAAKGQGAMGTPGYVKREHFDVVVYHDETTGDIVTRRLGERVQVEFEDADEVRARALSKLTPKEKKALGLK